MRVKKFVLVGEFQHGVWVAADFHNAVVQGAHQRLCGSGGFNQDAIAGFNFGGIIYQDAGKSVDSGVSHVVLLK
jgi:hypothetical protein